MRKEVRNTKYELRIRQRMMEVRSSNFVDRSFSKLLLIICAASLVLTSCEPTYKRSSMTESIRELAKREYNHDVFVTEIGNTIGVQLTIKNMLAELVAEDQQLWRHMEELLMVLSRVVLSSDIPPEFIVLDVVDEENTEVHLVFTRYVKDLQKLMGEAISRTAYLDRLLMEFVIGEKKMIFDPYEMDMVRLMMMAAETLNKKSEYYEQDWLEEVDFQEFLSKVTGNTMRRIFREEKKINRHYLLRKLSTEFDFPEFTNPNFRVLIDLVSIPGRSVKQDFIETKILPVIAKETRSIFRSYRFERFAEIIVVEKNTGKVFALPRK